MVDLYLQEMMAGKISSALHNQKTALNKEETETLSTLESEINKNISRQVEEIIALDSRNPTLNLEPIHIKRERIFNELKEAASFKELSLYIDNAINYLLNCNEIEFEEPLKQLHEALLRVKSIIDNFNNTLTDEKTLLETLQISTAHLELIENLALLNNAQTNYEISLALFVLLTTLAPFHEGYWYHAGLAAQRNNNIDLSIRLYQAAMQINENSFWPHLFLCDCFVKKAMLLEAKNHLTLGKTLLSNNDEDYDEAASFIKALEVDLNK